MQASIKIFSSILFSVPFPSFARRTLGEREGKGPSPLCKRLHLSAYRERRKNSFLSSLVIKTIFFPSALLSNLKDSQVFRCRVLWFTDFLASEMTKMTNVLSTLVGFSRNNQNLFYFLCRTELCLYGALTKPIPASTTSSSISRATFRTWSTYGNELLPSKKMKMWKKRRAWWKKSNQKRRSRHGSQTKTFLLSTHHHRLLLRSFAGSQARVLGIDFFDFRHSSGRSQLFREPPSISRFRRSKKIESQMAERLFQWPSPFQWRIW